MMKRHGTIRFTTLSSLAATFLFLALSVCSGSLHAQDTTWVPPIGGQQVPISDSVKAHAIPPPSTGGDAGQIPDSIFAVDSIFISGNEKTKDFVILRELSLHPGEMITTAA